MFNNVINHSGQRISPSPITGETGINVTIICTSSRPGEAENNVLQIFNPATMMSERLDSPRLVRVSDVDDLTTYLFGPLEETDDGAVLSCLSNRMESSNATLIITCMYM